MNPTNYRGFIESLKVFSIYCLLAVLILLTFEIIKNKDGAIVKAYSLNESDKIERVNKEKSALHTKLIYLYIFCIVGATTSLYLLNNE